MYLDRGISPPPPATDPADSFSYGGCTLVIDKLEEQENIYLHSDYSFPDGDVTLVVSSITSHQVAAVTKAAYHRPRM